MLRTAAAMLLSVGFLIASPRDVSAASSTSEAQFFATHRVIQTDKIWWFRYPVVMQYAIKGLATQEEAPNGDVSLRVQDFTVKVQITVMEGPFAGWVFADRYVSRNNVFRATYDAAQGVYRARAYAGFWFFTPLQIDRIWSVDWLGIVLSFAPGGPISVYAGTDERDDWSFL